MAEVEKARPAGPWIKLYENFRQAGMTKAEAQKATEEALGPPPKGVVLKGDDSGGFGDVAGFVPVLKVDEDLGLVMGFALVSKINGEDYFDTQGDNIPEDVMLKAAVEFMENSRLADEMHDYEDKGTVVFAFPLTTEVAKAFDIETATTGLMIAMKPSDATVLAKFKSGELTGFSIGGRGLREEVTT